MEFIKGGRSGASVDVGGGLELRREFEELRLGASAAEKGSSTVRIEAPGAGEASLELAGSSFRVTWSPAEQPAVAGPSNDDGDSYSFLPENAIWPLEVRSWLPGDRIRLGGGSRKLKRVFGDRRVPLSERGRIPVLSDAEGRVLWVRGIAKAGEASVSDPGSGVRERSLLTIEIEEC